MFPLKNVLVRPKEELDAIYEEVCRKAELKRATQKKSTAYPGKVEIIERMISLINNGADKKEAWILQTLKENGITPPLSFLYTQEELQEQQSIKDRIAKEVKDLKDILLEKDCEDIGSFEYLYNPIMYGGYYE
jgi:hypothetical protein